MKRLALLAVLPALVLIAVAWGTPRPASAADVWFDTIEGGYPGDYAYVGAWAPPGALCSIVYITPRGNRSTAQGLYTHRADRDGWIEWSWFIGTNTIPGWGRVTVSCSPGGTVSDWIEIYG